MKTGRTAGRAAGRTAAGIAAALIVTAGVSGCAAGASVGKQAADSAEALVATLAKASDDASKAGSADVRMTVTMPDTGGKPVQMNGVYSWGNGLAMEAETPAKDLEMEDLVADGTITYRLVQGSYYYGVDPAPEGPFKGKTWLKLDASAVLGDKGAAAMESGNNDPTAGLKSLKWANNVTKIGKEDVNGKSSVHYRATVPSDKLGDAASAFGAMGGGAGDLVSDIWVDDKGMPSRLNQTVGTTSVNVDFLSFGVAKDITAPPAADTADITDLVKSGGAAQG
ncbi:putative lipoprotein [Streptomyces avidinii]